MNCLYEFMVSFWVHVSEYHSTLDIEHGRFPTQYYVFTFVKVSSSTCTPALAYHVTQGTMVHQPKHIHFNCRQLSDCTANSDISEDIGITSPLWWMTMTRWLYAVCWFKRKLHKCRFRSYRHLNAVRHHVFNSHLYDTSHGSCRCIRAFRLYG